MKKSNKHLFVAGIILHARTVNKTHKKCSHLEEDILIGES